MSDYPDAIDYFVDQSRVFTNQNSHSAIVVHCTGGSPDQTSQELGDYFRSNSLMTSVHYGIDRPGVICQYVREVDGAAGNCCLEAGHDPYWDRFGGDNLNIHTISIECVNDATNSLTLTDLQQQSLFKLVAYLCKKYELTPDQIKTHASIAPIDRARCPGDAYPLQGLKDYVRQNQGGNTDMAVTVDDQVIQRYFHVDGDHLVRNDKPEIYLFGGIKGLYLLLGGVAVCGLPSSREQYWSQYPNTAYVLCERVLIVYDPERKIDNPPVPASWPGYLMHIDGGIGQQLIAQSAQTTLAGELVTANSKLDKIKQIVN